MVLVSNLMEFLDQFLIQRFRLMGVQDLFDAALDPVKKRCSSLLFPILKVISINQLWDPCLFPEMLNRMRLGEEMAAWPNLVNHIQGQSLFVKLKSIRPPFWLLR